MADKFLNNTGLAYYHSRIKQEFASQSDLDALDQKVDDIVAEGGEPNVIETVKVNGVALLPDALKAVNVDLTSNSYNATTSVSGTMSATDKSKLDAVESGAEANIIETVKVNGTALVPDAQKAVNVSVPTSTRMLTNESAFPGMAIYDNDSMLTLNVADGENVWDANFHNDAAGKTVVFNVTDENGIGDGWTATLATTDYVQANGGKIDTISVNNVPQTITNKNVNITVPTVVSDLTNDSGYQNATQVQTAIDNALADITGIDFKVVQTLPATGEKGVIYLVENTGTTPNIYDEYIWIEQTSSSGAFEKIGTTEVDLSNYWTSTSGQNNSLVAITTAEIDIILAS